MATNETNSCDKCKSIESICDLIWLTSEDFEPTKEDIKQGYSIQKFQRAVSKNYDALCIPCYYEEVVK